VRPRSAALVLLASLTAGALAPATAAPATKRHRAPHRARTLLVDGDSLAVGTEPFLPGLLRGWRIHQSASISRHAPEGVSLLHAYGRGLPRVVVLSLGTNDDPRATGAFRRQIRRALHIIGRHRCLVWANVVRPPYAGASYRGYNIAIGEEARAHVNMLAFDWHRMARHHPYWFGPDGVHPTATGYRVRARAIARLVRNCPPA
jgi:lysophospholipase L1-like esterase